MTRSPQIGFLSDGRRFHLQDGPIDLIIEASADAAKVRLAYAGAAGAFTGLLDRLCEELPELRRPPQPPPCLFKSKAARRMHSAVTPFAAEHFITPMAAVAGAVADEILDAMCRTAPLRRAYVNNGGDIALYLAEGEQFTVGLVDRPDALDSMFVAFPFGKPVSTFPGNAPVAMRTTIIKADDPTRGIATSGRHGRSFSLGIADAVTVLARTAAQADAAATIIANAVDLPGHPAIVRRPASELQPDSDLGTRLVTRDVGVLQPSEIATALEAGENCARALLARGLIDGAALRLHGEMRVVALQAIDARPMEGVVHA